MMIRRCVLFCCLALVAAERLVAAEDFQPLATIRDQRLNESSGMAASRHHPGSLWVHNDSGDSARLFLVGPDGQIQALVNVTAALARDWEDMCSFEIDGEAWLLIGDIGDNDKQRTDSRFPCHLYLLKEPRIPRSNGQPIVSWPISIDVQFDYDDGPWNCEGVAVDVERREILLLTKAVPHRCGLFVLPLDLKSPEQKRTAKRIHSPFVPFATALDIDPSGRTMVVGSMLDGLIIRRQGNQNWTEAAEQTTAILPLPQRQQGETICFDLDGQWLFLNSEKTDQPLWKIPVPARQ
ncbi:MAG: hypothetical protein R3C49_06485 [Planctomycetaceae bacterium]